MTPGEVRRVWVNADRLNPASGRKRRPGVLVAPGRKPGHWLVMGLTTLRTYGDGRPRTELQDWALYRCRRATHLWGENPVILPAHDIGPEMGVLTERDARLIIAKFDGRLTAGDIDRFLAGATGAWPEPEPLPEGIDAFAGLPS